MSSSLSMQLAVPWVSCSRQKLRVANCSRETAPFPSSRRIIHWSTSAFQMLLLRRWPRMTSVYSFNRPWTAHKKSNGLPIVFLAGSQAAKNLALQVSSGQVIVTNGTAMHIGENHHLGSTNQLIDGVFQDFWTALGTQYLFAGRRLSGLSLTAASMSFLPQDHVFDTHCKASWESDNFENLGMP